MAIVVNDRDVELESISPRVAGVSQAPNIIIDPSQVTGLGLVILASKAVALSATSQFFQISKTGVVSPASTTVVATVKNLTGTPTLTIAPGGGTMSVTPSLTLGVFTFTEAQMTSETLTLQLQVVEDGVTYTDTMTFIKVREGSDGVNALLTNENVILPADYLGNVTNYAGADGNFKVYQGVNDVTSVCTFALAPGGNPQGLTYSLTASGTSAGTYSITGGFPAAATVAKLTMRATFGTAYIDKTFTVSKSIAGTPGDRGSLQFYVTLDGSANTWDDSLATLAASVGGGPLKFDVVTESNDSMHYSESRFWTGSAWTVINAVVNGNLLVTGTVGASAIVAHSLSSDQITVGSLIGDSLAAATITGNKIVANTLTADLIDSRGLDIRASDGTIIFSAGHALSFDNISNTLASTISINAVTGAGFRAGTVTWDSAGAWISGYGVAMTPGGITAWDSSGNIKFSLDATTGNAYFAGTLAVGTASDSSSTGSAVSTNVSNTTSDSPVTGFDTSDIVLVTKTCHGKPIEVTVTANLKVQTHTNTNIRGYLTATLDGTTQTIAGGFTPQFQVDDSNTAIQSSGSYQPWGIVIPISWKYMLTPSAASHTFGIKGHCEFYDHSGSLTAISGITFVVEAMAVVTELLA